MEEILEIINFAPSIMWLSFKNFIVFVLESENLRQWITSLFTPLTLWLIANKVTLELAKQQNKDADERNKKETLINYLDRMTALLIDKHLSLKSFESAEARAARALTVSVLRELDLERRKQLIDFLYEAELIQYRCSGAAPALLKGVNLSELDLSEVYLEKADLTNTNLKNAKLINTKLFEADLTRANLDGADLSEAKLTKAKFNYTFLSQTKLHEAYLPEAILIQSNFRKLKETDLMRVNFNKAKYDDENCFPDNFNFGQKRMEKI